MNKIYRKYNTLKDSEIQKDLANTKDIMILTTTLLISCEN
jgi:hypothetical protein